MSFDYTGRYTNSSGKRRDVSGDRRSSPNYSPITDNTSWNNCTTDANESTFPDMNISSQMGTRSNMNMRANPVMMVHAAACIKNDIITDYCTCVDYYTSTNHNTLP